MVATLKPDFVEYIRTILPKTLNIDDFTSICLRPLRRSIRVNTLKISVADFKSRMEPKGWIFSEIPWCSEGFWLQLEDESISLGNTIEHLAGLFYIQEASSMLPPVALFDGLSKKELILDMAAAPGSKTTQMAALMQQKGCLVANEYSASRLKGLFANVQRLGIRQVALTNFDGRVFGHYAPETFDAILLDAPCGGEGSVRKDPQALQDWSLSHVDTLADTQQELLIAAFRALKVGGSLVYSTCTLNMIENQEVCYALKALFGDAVAFENLSQLFTGADKVATEDGFLHVWPQVFDSEGFFVAKITKMTSVFPAYETKRPIKPMAFIPVRLTAEIDDYFQQQFSVKPSDFGQVMQRDKEYWLFPNSFSTLSSTVKFHRVGIRLGETIKKGFKTSHDAVMSLPVAGNKVIDLTEEEAQQYLMGRDIFRENLKPCGEVVVTFKGQPLGLCKGLANKLKNSLPRVLVRDHVVFT